MVKKESDSGSYKSILKATSTFGGVQVFNIFLNLIRNKLVAVIIGATGMGINSLFNSSLSMVTTFSGLGLNISAVRNISESHASGDILTLNRTVAVFKTLLKYCSILGAALLVVLSPFLSKHTFGSYDYTYSFILLSSVLVFRLLSQGNNSLLQGTRKLGYMAKSSVIGSIVSLFLSIPLYYFFGIKGIVPALIITSLGIYLVSRYFSRKIKIKKPKLKTSEIISSGGEMTKLGLAMVASQLLGQTSVYLLNTFISNKGGLSDVGYYHAAMSLTNQSITLVFASMSADYFPRLVAVSNDSQRLSKTVNQQGEILILIAFPILMLVIIFSKLLILMLLSSEFNVISNIVKIISFGMLFKVMSYSIGYISFAKGDRKTFLILEGIYSNISQLFFNVIGYSLGGLKGLAISFVFIFASYFIIISIVSYKKYQYKISKKYFKLLLPVIILSILALFVSFISHQLIMYIMGSLLILISFCLSYIELNKRVDIKSIVIGVKNRFK